MNIEQFLDLVSNADKYKAKLAELKKAQEEAEQAVALVGPAKEITRMRAIAQTEVEKIAKEIAARRQDCDEEIAKAKAAVQKKADELSAFQADLAKKEKSLAETAASLDRITAEILADRDQAAQALITLEEKQAELAKKEAELDAKLAKLKAIAG